MRYTRYSLAATLVAGAAASQHGHQHLHKKHASPVEKRGASPVVEYVVGPTETVYEMAGKVLDVKKAKAGIDSGDFVIIGETTPTFSAPPAPKVTEAKMGAQFIELSDEEPKETELPPPPPPKKQPPTTGGGIDSPFPSGKVKCSDFPSSYGAVALDWLDFGGWSGLQFVPDYTPSSSSIVEIHTGIAGDNCKSGAMCTYACPPGYQPSQWPKAQGSTKQSVGGLYCNSDGFLELTRDGHETLCMKGAGGVSIKNDLDKVVATCRTVYPGTESMVIPATANPGDSVELCNPMQSEYMWDGLPTSAQYYVNKAGYSTEEACVWNSPIDPKGAGNWSPIIIGVGKAEDGVTYLSIFQNLPTSTAKLNFNIEITGDVTVKCSYIDGVWSGGGSDGCTTGMKDGGSAVFRYF